jgi:hypothetical protein
MTCDMVLQKKEEEEEWYIYIYIFVRKFKVEIGICCSDICKYQPIKVVTSTRHMTDLTEFEIPGIFPCLKIHRWKTSQTK